MPSAETTGVRAIAATKRTGAGQNKLPRFSVLLAQHLRDGTGLKKAGARWTYAAFAGELSSARSSDGTVSARSVANWCQGRNPPTTIEPILPALFKAGDVLGPERNALMKAWKEWCAERMDATLKKAKLDAAGATWVVSGARLLADRGLSVSDDRAAKNPLQQQFQHDVCDLAGELVELTSRPSNSALMTLVSTKARIFRELLKCDPTKMPERLTSAYKLSLQLAGFLETDDIIAADTSGYHVALDPIVRDRLQALVRTAAPWLHGYPWVRHHDRAIDWKTPGHSPADLVMAASQFINHAVTHQIISGEDAADVVISLPDMVKGENADPALSQTGWKALGFAVADTKNLLVAAARAVAIAQRGIAGREGFPAELIQRLTWTLLAAEPRLDALLATMSADMRQAVHALCGEVRRVEAAGRADGSASGAPDVPDDCETQALGMILRGDAPPAAWHPFIRSLSFVGEEMKSLNLLAGLTALQYLDLKGTQVADIAPLAGLTALQSLDLRGTQVADIAPLAGLTALQSLYLRGTQVADIAPLAGLTALQSLDLRGTQVADIAPLAGLTALQTLYLQDTQVADIAPLAGLTALQSLYLRGTQVADIAPLAGLTALQSLDLRGTQVADIAPLAGLTALQTLYLQDTQVADIAPLAGLTALQSLDLRGTQVADIAPLAGLTALQSVNLEGTQVADIAPLAGLTALQSLDLVGTQVADIAPLAGLTALEYLYLRGTQVVDIAPLAGLTALEYLYLQGTQVADIAPLAGLTALQSVNLEGTQVADIAPLAGLTALQSLDLEGTQVADIAPLAHLHRLTIYYDE